MPSTLNTDVREFIIRQFPLARKRGIKDTDALLEGGILDSQGVLEVVTFIEQEYGISVPDDDLVPDNFQSVERITAYVESRTS
jgi:acyl carrier protein